jgi:hypothetical protein
MKPVRLEVKLNPNIASHRKAIEVLQNLAADGENMSEYVRDLIVGKVAAPQGIVDYIQRQELGVEEELTDKHLSLDDILGGL